MKDQLSALIDGELELDGTDHLITSVKSGGELKEAWQHYHLIGDAIRGNTPLRRDFTAQVMQALDAEPTVIGVSKNKLEGSAKTKHASGKLSLFGSHRGWSIAASVAAVMFVGLILLQHQIGGNQDLTPVEIADSMPVEYLAAHQAAAPSSSAYYIQTASFNPAEIQK